MAKSPREIAQKWSRNLSASGESIKSGVNSVQESPGEAALRQKDAYASGVARSVADGTYERGLRSFTKEDWKKAMLEKGLPRIASGAAAAQSDVEQFMQEFLPHVEAGQRMLESMPRGDFETNMQRAYQMARHNAEFKRR